MTRRIESNKSKLFLSGLVILPFNFLHLASKEVFYSIGLVQTSPKEDWLGRLALGNLATLFAAHPVYLAWRGWCTILAGARKA